MVVALTGRQWSALVQATGTGPAFEKIEKGTGRDFTTEVARFEERDLIAAVLRRWFASRTLAEVRAAFEGTTVSWGPYQTFRQLVTEDTRCSTANPMFQEVEHPCVGTYLMPRSPIEFSVSGRLPVQRAPLLGEHTDEILAEVLGLPSHTIGDLHDRRVVAGPSAAE